MIFSKLKTGTWPSFEVILDKIRSYMSTSSLQIQLNVENYDIEGMDPADMKKRVKNKLFDIEVILTPAAGKGNNLNKT